MKRTSFDVSLTIHTKVRQIHQEESIVCKHSVVGDQTTLLEENDDAMETAVVLLFESSPF